MHRGFEALTAAGADFPSIKLIPWPYSFVCEMSGGGKNHKYGVSSRKWCVEGGFLNLPDNEGGDKVKKRGEILKRKKKNTHVSQICGELSLL